MDNTRAQDAAFRQAFDDVNHCARFIANCIVAGVDVPAESVDAYAGARGRLDRIVDTMAGTGVTFPAYESAR